MVTEEEDSEAASKRFSLTTTRGREIKTAEDVGLARQEREKGEECVHSPRSLLKLWFDQFMLT